VENPGQNRSDVQLQLAILEVVDRVDGETTEEIVDMLRDAMVRRRISPPPGTWLSTVARDASIGNAYVVRQDVVDEARYRRTEASVEQLSEVYVAPAEDPAGTGTSVHLHRNGLPPKVFEVPIDVPVPDRTPELRGYLGVPNTQGPWPAVVMLHEAFAIDDVMLRQVQRMADAGFLVLMPDLFSAGTSRRCLSATFRALSEGRGRAFSDIEAARRFLLNRTDCTGVAGVLGFCMGGGFALASASRGFSAAAVNYGPVPKNISEVLEGACPVVASYGKRDLTLLRAKPRLEKALRRKGIPSDVKSYPGAGHGFLNDAPTGPAWLQPVAKLIMGAGPNPEAAADAWRRIEDFFRLHLQEIPEGRR
jgi:carboxymethylenebutenolidase